jgi:hypothetical protein
MLTSLKDSNPTQYASNDVWVAMEHILDRLDGTYGMTNEEGDEVLPEDMHKRRVQIMCGIVKNALDMGINQGMQQAENNLIKTLRGETK